MGGGVWGREEVEVRWLVGVFVWVADLEEDGGGFGCVGLFGEVEGYGYPEFGFRDVCFARLEREGNARWAARGEF